jgi:hypothetical protein
MQKILIVGMPGRGICSALFLWMLQWFPHLHSHSSLMGKKFVENMINSTKGGELALRKLGGVLSFSLPFHLLFAAFLPNLKFCSSLVLDDHF